MRPQHMVRCILGDHMVEERQAMQRVQGFEKPRREGGANQIVLRETLNEWGCWECVNKLRAGVPIDQPGLFT
jgi:hypothetical protein